MEAYVYTMIDEQKLSELLEALYVCIELPVQLLDETAGAEYYGKKAPTVSILFLIYLPKIHACIFIPPPESGQ